MRTLTTAKQHDLRRDIKLSISEFAGQSPAGKLPRTVWNTWCIIQQISSTGQG